MGRFIIHWIVLAAGLAIAVSIVPGIVITSPATLALAALVLGLINAVVRPILLILTLPITILTLGLFYLVVNGLAFALAAALVPGFRVAGFGPAVLGALVVSVFSWVVGALVPKN